MKRNLSNTDRTIRIIIAAVFAYLYFTGIATGILGIILLALGAILVLTGILAVCPLYLPFKINTYK